jgi:AcrR family transcriptional regulator
VSIHKTLKEAIYQTIHRNSNKSINDIAEECGLSASSLYRYCADEETTSHAELPLRNLLSILNSTNNDCILDYLDARRGRIAFNVPKADLSKLEEGELVDEYQQMTIDAVSALRRFLSKPDAKNYEKIESALRDIMQITASLNQYCSKKSTGQLEMKI